jgi:hypothetical protein
VTIHLAPDEETAVTANQTPTAIGEINFSGLTSDGDMANVLAMRWDEVGRCLEAGANVAAMVMAGSVLEGALLAIARDRPGIAGLARAAPRTKDKSVLPLEQWNFYNLIQVAGELAWFPSTITGFANAIRGLRNYVHPWTERHAPDAPTASIAKLTAMSVEQILRHLVDSPPLR